MQRTRLERIRGRKAGIQGVVYLLVAGLIVIAMIVWGVKGIASLAGMFVKPDTDMTDQYELKPTPPIFSDVPEATFSATVNISGFAQPGVDVALYLNGAEVERKLTAESGTFKFEEVPVSEGENTIYAYSLTSRDLTSEKSKEPKVTLDSPRDGDVFRGQTQRIANFAGAVDEAGSKVYIGERMVIVQSDGKFTLPYQLVEGDQEIQIRAVDHAGNENISTIKLRWEP